MQNSLFNTLISKIIDKYPKENVKSLMDSFYVENGYWFSNEDEASVLCSFFLSLLDHSEVEARLVLSPKHDITEMINEICDEVIPVVIHKFA